VGPALGTLAGGFLLVHFGWRMFFVALGVLSLLWLAPWFYFARNLNARALPGEAARPSGPATLEILTKRSAWGAFFGHFCGNYFWYFLLTWLPTYLVRERALSTETMVRVTSISLFAIAGATLCAGWVSDRWIRAGGTPTRVRKTVVCTGLGCSLLILPVAVVEDQTLALVLLMLASMSFGVYASNHWAITQTLAGPLAAGRWSSLQNGVGNLAGIVASWLTGAVVDRTGSFAIAFAVSGLIAITGALMWGVVVGPVREVEWKSGSHAA